MTEAEKIVITKYDLIYEQRMTRVETALESLADDVKEIKKDIKTDFRWIFGIILGSNAGLFALMAHGFKWF
jgi:G3E family GTPase